MSQQLFLLSQFFVFVKLKVMVQIEPKLENKLMEEMASLDFPLPFLTLVQLPYQAKILKTSPYSSPAEPILS